MTNILNDRCFSSQFARDRLTRTKRSFLAASLFFVVGILVFLSTGSAANADIFLSMDSQGSQNFNTGSAGAGKLLAIHISQDATSNDRLAVWVADFDLEAGDVTGGQVSATGSGTDGFFAAGNLSTSDFTLTSTNSFEVNQETTDFDQAIPQEPVREKWFELTIDTTGLADGTYDLILRSPTETFLDPDANFVTVGNQLTFTVSSVPEPGVIHFLGFLTAFFIGRRKRSASQQ
ncbi:MAG: hypothetical protein AB8B55_24710 [Mariniblastus sp.]